MAAVAAAVALVYVVVVARVRSLLAVRSGPGGAEGGEDDGLEVAPVDRDDLAGQEPLGLGPASDATAAAAAAAAAAGGFYDEVVDVGGVVGNPAGNPAGDLGALGKAEIRRFNVEAETRDDLFVLPDFSLVLPSLKSSRRIVVDYPFHQFSDDFGLIEPAFDSEQLQGLMREISDVWIKGNIWVRFKKGDAETRTKLSPAMSSVYKWFITSPKHPKHVEHKAGLAELVDAVGIETADRISNKLIKGSNGHQLLNWILGIGGHSGPLIFFHVYTVFYFPWYNGGTSRGRIFTKSGSCNSKRTFADSGLPVKCAANIRPTDSPGDLHPAEFVRILAHEIGHSLLLQHPHNTRCQVADAAHEMDLMRQQRAVTLRGTKCGVGNPHAKFARRMSVKEYQKARQRASELEGAQVAFYQAHPEALAHPTSPTEHAN